MKRFELEPAKVNPHFIGSWLLESPGNCAALMDFFENHPEAQTLGKTAGGLNPEAKHSIDLSTRPRDLERPEYQPVRDYIETLYHCYQDYLEQWPFLKTFMSRIDIGSFNLQRYEAGGHFLKVHSERTTLASSHRVLAWMTYLNDVEDGGATHFIHQQMDIQPRQGLTLIWPAEWTHAHQGQVVKAGRKYIITGWMHFPPRESADTASG